MVILEITSDISFFILSLIFRTTPQKKIFFLLSLQKQKFIRSIINHLDLF